MMECSTRPDRRVLGASGEYTARLLLQEEGLHLLETNWRDGRRGELDIIARDDTDPRRSWTVVVEVRTRVGRRRGSALESVDHRKVARLRTLTGAWCRTHGPQSARVRIDVFAHNLDPHKLSEWPAPMDEAVDLRALDARVTWLRGVQ